MQFNQQRHQLCHLQQGHPPKVELLTFCIFHKLAVKQFKGILKLNNLNFVILSTAPSTMPPSTKPSTKGKITDYAFVSPWIASKIGVIR